MGFFTEQNLKENNGKFFIHHKTELKKPAKQEPAIVKENGKQKINAEQLNSMLCKNIKDYSKI